MPHKASFNLSDAHKVDAPLPPELGVVLPPAKREGARGRAGLGIGGCASHPPTVLQSAPCRNAYKPVGGPGLGIERSPPSPPATLRPQPLIPNPRYQMT